MKILVLNGSPRPNGNTAHFVSAFKKAAEENENTVNIVNVGQMNIHGCNGCDYCNLKGNGNCCIKDDMDIVNAFLEGNDLVIFASPVHYWGFSGELQCMITRLYNRVKIDCPKFALILSSASNDVYDALKAQYENMVSYFGGESIGEFTFNGDNQINEENLKIITDFAKSL